MFGLESTYRVNMSRFNFLRYQNEKRRRLQIKIISNHVGVRHEKQRIYGFYPKTSPFFCD